MTKLLLSYARFMKHRATGSWLCLKRKDRYTGTSSGYVSRYRSDQCHLVEYQGKIWIRQF
eukprot:6187420-Pleurochrysis_carterae.AAC.3